MRGEGSQTQKATHWLRLYYILEKAKLLRKKTAEQLSEAEPRELTTKERAVQSDGNILHLGCGGSYMKVYIG